MDVITLIIVACVVLFSLWLVQRYLNIDPTIKNIVLAVIVIVAVLWFLSAVGILNVGSLRVGK